MVASVLVFTMPAPPAAAHTDLVGSDPAADSTLREPPDRVTLRFNEPMEPRLSKVALTMPGQDAAELPVTAGSELTNLVADIPGEGMAGAWEVAYRVTSTDGHPVQGTLSFTVRPPANAATEDPEDTEGNASSDDPADARGSEENASSEPADGAASGGGKQTSDAREDDGAGSWRLVAPVLLGGFLLLLAALLLVIRFTRVAPVESIDGTAAETTNGGADADAGHGVAGTGTDADTSDANSEADVSEPDQPEPRR
ncbi:Copper resistance protein C precursor [Nocardioides dokdonensis FR1436]|uniref:Copper resistance protein C n=2 Tax=Nocardioides TaxID=1839 RepID=A0A1A9GQC9_9ACTN|nr:Copper resistance protein C precursor [Nocardioides dokdonensis FR1436]